MSDRSNILPKPFFYTSTIYHTVISTKITIRGSKLKNKPFSKKKKEALLSLGAPRCEQTTLIQVIVKGRLQFVAAKVYFSPVKNIFILDILYVVGSSIPVCHTNLRNCWKLGSLMVGLTDFRNPNLPQLPKIARGVCWPCILTSRLPSWLSTHRLVISMVRYHIVCSTIQLKPYLQT